MLITDGFPYPPFCIKKEDLWKILYESGRKWKIFFIFAIAYKN